jgi:hypothetical protein
MKLAIRLLPTPPFPCRERCTLRVLLVSWGSSSIRGFRINEFGVNDFDMAVLNLLFLK